MTNLIPLITTSFILIVLALLGMSIGWLLTGKPKITKAGCGRNPLEKKDSQDSSCSLCSSTCHKDCSSCGFCCDKNRPQ